MTTITLDDGVSVFARPCNLGDASVTGGGNHESTLLYVERVEDSVSRMEESKVIQLQSRMDLCLLRKHAQYPRTYFTSTT